MHAPSERLTPRQAIEAVTSEAAFAIPMDDEIGTLRPRKKADFTGEDHDPTAVPAGPLRDVVVEATIFEGTVYPIEPFAPAKPTTRTTPSTRTTPRTTPPVTPTSAPIAPQSGRGRSGETQPGRASAPGEKRLWRDSC